MALRDQPYLPLYIQDFLTDEKLMECSASTLGIYIKLMCILHKQEEYGVILLKQKDKQNTEQVLNFAYKVAKFLPYNLVDVVEAIHELLNEKVLHIEGDKLIQKRMQKDGLISDERKKSGSAGGKKTQLKNKKFAKAKSKANSEYESDNESEGKKSNYKGVDFDTFWNLYEKKVGLKEKVEKMWNDLKVSDRELAIAYIPNYKLSQPNKKFRKNPTTFINNKSWLDEIIMPSQPGSKLDNLIKANQESQNPYENANKLELGID